MTKINVDKARLFRRAIILSWVVLIVCFVVKIFGGNFFEIMTDNENYKALCEFADTHFFVKYPIALCSSLLCQSLYTLAVLQECRFTKGQLIATTISVLVATLVKYFNSYVGLACDVWLLFLLPLIFLKDVSRSWEVLLAVCLNFGFQIISLATKNLAFGFIDDSTFITLIYGIDVYIMCFLYYLYRNYKKENKSMGMFWTLFMGKPVDKLVSMKEKKLEKIAKLQKEVSAIEAEIERQKASEK